MVVLMRNARASLFVVALAAVVAATAPGLASRTAGLKPPTTRGAQPAETPRQIIDITAERFAFTPSEVKVKAGTTLEIRLRSDDTAHGFHIVGTDVDMELPKRGRGVATVTFTPKAGRYTFECSRLCGAGHEFMRGVIVASE
jgi:cytochrome c oxidase subunit 2